MAVIWTDEFDSFKPCPGCGAWIPNRETLCLDCEGIGLDERLDAERGEYDDVTDPGIPKY